jgi:hypothetical protein
MGWQLCKKEISQHFSKYFGINISEKLKYKSRSNSFLLIFLLEICKKVPNIIVQYIF